MSFFKAESLHVGYKHRTVIRDGSFSLPRGCIAGVLGANGSGKSTLIRAICGILPHGGSCTLGGVSLETLSAREISRLCGYIPQRSGILIDIPVIDVVLMGFHASLGLFSTPTAAMRDAASASLAAVGLGGMEEHNYQNLSEGQKQLCIFARTLVYERQLLLLDEPESALDYAMRYRMMAHLRQYIDRTQGCALMALHDPVLALNSCDRLLFLSDGVIAGTVSPSDDDPAEITRHLQTVYGQVRPERIDGQWVLLRAEALSDFCGR